MNAEADARSARIVLLYWRVGAVLSGPLYGLLAGFATLGGVSIIAEALGRETGFEVLMMSLWAALFAGGAGTLASLAAITLHLSSEGLARGLRLVWRYQLIALPVIVIAFTLLQFSVDPLPA